MVDTPIEVSFLDYLCDLSGCRVKSGRNDQAAGKGSEKVAGQTPARACVKVAVPLVVVVAREAEWPERKASPRLEQRVRLRH